MPTQRCTQCGSKLNISNLEQGSKFACFNCGTILVAGAQPKAVKKSLGEGPVFKPRSRADESKTPTLERSRSRATAVVAPAASSKMPLLVAGVVVLVGAVIAVAMSGSGGGDSGGAVATKETAQEWWARTAAQVDQAKPQELRGLLDYAKSRGYDSAAGWSEISKTIHAALLEKDPANTAANEYLGRKSLSDHPGFGALWAQMNDHYKLLDKETRAFLKKYEDRVESGEKVWLDTAEFDAAAVVLANFAKWTERLKNDPSIMQIEKGRTRARGELDKFDAGAVVARPFILFVGYRKPPDGDPEALRPAREALGRKLASALSTMVAEFEKRFREPLELPATGVDTALYFWLFEDQADQVNFAQATPLFPRIDTRSKDAGSDVLGGFNVKSRWSYAGVPTDPAAAKLLGNNLAHIAAQQLQWHYSRDPEKTFLNYFEEWNGLWFTVGFAAWLGGGIEHDKDTGAARWTGVDPRRKAHLQLMAQNGVPWVGLREFTQLESWEGFRRWIGNTWWPQLAGDEAFSEQGRALVAPDLHGFALRTLYAQAWGLAHFLNEKHPEQYRDLLLTALRGKRKPEKYVTDRLKRWRNTYSAFADIFSLKSDADWERLSAEYEKHLAGLAR